MRSPKCFLPLVWLAIPQMCPGWHHPVHYMLTRAALDSLPEAVRQAFGGEIGRLIERYSVYPDLYGFVGEEQRAQMRRFCFTPEERPIHNVNWRTEEDLDSLVYLLTSISGAMRQGDHAAAAQYAGVLSHFLADSTCPAHALLPFDSSLRTLVRPPRGKAHVNLHAAIELTSPQVEMARRKPRLAGESAASAARELLARCYAAIRQNRETLEEIGSAAYAGNEEGMNPGRLRAARAGAELIADAYYTAVHLAQK